MESMLRKSLNELHNLFGFAFISIFHFDYLELNLEDGL